MAKETIVLKNETFVVTHKPFSDYESNSSRVRELTLDSCYERPSRAKENIFDYWFRFFCPDTYSIVHTSRDGIQSYNCMMFTYGAASVINYNGVQTMAIFYITKTRQEVTIYDL